MSSNFFAALDDSGDEGPAQNKAVAKKKETTAKPVEKVAEASKPARRETNNDRNTKHGRGGRAPVRDGKRAYDRRSGTGRGKEIKKGGGGARNWGNEKADAKKLEGKIDENEVKEDKPVVEEREAPVVETPEPEPEPVPDNTITFADYMASKEKKEEKVRDVENEFQGKAAAKKVEEDFLVMGSGKSKKKKQAKDNKQKVEVGFRVAKPDSDGGRDEGRGGRGEGRGGRGEGRGGRGRGEGRGRGDRGRGEGRGGRGRGEGRGGEGRGRGGRGEGRGGRGEGRGRGPKNPGLNVQDETAFPSL